MGNRTRADFLSRIEVGRLRKLGRSEIAMAKCRQMLLCRQARTDGLDDHVCFL